MSEYETELAAWKARHGLNATPDSNSSELLMASEDAKSNEDSWCMACGKQMPVKEMRIVTKRIDPYMQLDEQDVESDGDYIREENRVRMCPPCFTEKYEKE